jgi:putative ABC transport system ATP-binding protein
MILNVENLGKTYSDGQLRVDALKNLNFQMQAGDTLAIIGPSGSGKSTLLTLLAGLDNPSQGSIKISETDLASLNERDLSYFRAKNMGIVFQQFHLVPYLSALENIQLPLEIMNEENIQDRSIAALKSVGLEHRAHHKPEQMSGGEKQRVAIARALVVNPKILLADEPSGNLDTETGETVMNLLFDLVNKNNMTLLLVTHNKDHAKLCKRTIALKAGLMQ